MKVKLTHRTTDQPLPIIVAKAESATGNGTAFNPNLHGVNALQHARKLAAAAKRTPGRAAQEHAAEYDSIVIDLELRSA